MPYKTGSWGEQAKQRSRKRNKYFHLWRSKNKQKWKAHRKVHTAVKSGKLKKGLCVVCGSDIVQAHHEDYLKPLEVIWVCHLHHRELHYKKLTANHK